MKQLIETKQDSCASIKVICFFLYKHPQKALNWLMETIGRSSFKWKVALWAQNLLIEPIGHRKFQTRYKHIRNTLYY